MVAAQPACANIQEFHSTSAQAASRPTWMPMRVKTPWIDALTQSREAAKAGSQGNAAKVIKPDLTPKKMSDSAYSAVCY
jgi:acyl-coenzyme A thioesterase 9